MKKLFLLIAMILLPMVANAYDAQIDGIYFKLKKDSKTAEVTYRNFGESNSTAYSGDIVIPSEIFHDGITYRVDSIGWNAFSYCTELTSISIPEGVTTICYYAFSDCTSLNNITIPNSIKVINRDAFMNTPLVDSQPDGVVYIGKYVYKYKGNMIENTQIKLEEGTLGIADCAFLDCTNLTSITTPSSLNFIGWCAFCGCSNLTIAKFESGLKTIGKVAFGDCSSLFSVDIPIGVDTIDDGAFQMCKSLSSVNVPNSVSYIGRAAFHGCSNLTSLTIPDGVRSIEEHTFWECNNLAYVTIPQSITSIGNEAFYNCSSLAYVNIPTNVTSIGYQAFYGCKNITSIVIPNGVTTIEDHTFYDCSSLSSVSIPNGITSIGRYAFAKCSSLKSIIIPPKVTNIGESAFMNCWGLGTVNISDASSWCNISFDNEYSNPTYYAKCLYINESKLSILKDLSNISKINKYAFINCIDLTSVSLPNDITIIGESAFSGCTKLTNIDLPKELKIIQMQAFSNCCELKELVIPSKVELIYQEAFSGCSNLEIIKALPTTPPFLYDNSFSYFSVPVKVPKGYKQAYQSAQGWKNFTNISDADRYKLTYVVDNEVYKTYDIEEGSSITPEAEPTKEGYTFSGWSEIPQTMPAHDVTVTGTFTQVIYDIDDVTYEITGEGTVTVKGGEQKGEVTIEATVVINGQTYSVTAIADNAFKDNKDITSLTIPEGITIIGDNAFDGCIGLVLINIGKDIQFIGNKAFANVGTVSAARTRSVESSIVVNCYAESVPQTALDAFENTPIETASLFVDDNSVNAYKTTSPWSGFGKIMGFDEAAGIYSITIGTTNAHIYDMQGNRLDNVRKGVNIIRMKDGKTKKVMVK